MPDTPRHSAVDAFRGVTIALMIIVNNQGDWSHVYRAFRHAAWHGWLGADIVFPFFLFILGVSISLSFTARSARGDSRWASARKIVSRSAVLVGLGLAINFLPDFSLASVRIPGVLQRIGVCYLFVALIFLRFGAGARWAISLALLAGYGLILHCLAPGAPGDAALSPAGNVCLAVDRFLLAGHTYAHAAVPGFDPEGIVSTLGALASALAGTLAGDLLVKTGSGESTRRRATGALFIAGGIAVAAGEVLSFWIPINKNLWTPSYAVFMAGMSSVFLAALNWIMEEKKLTAWATPFLALGMNAIVAYVLSSALGKFLALVKLVPRDGGYIALKTALYETLFASWLKPHAASLTYSLAYLLFWTAAIYVLYRKRIFIKI